VTPLAIKLDMVIMLALTAGLLTQPANLRVGVPSSGKINY
jgi:hypothetical protein